MQISPETKVQVLVIFKLDSKCVTIEIAVVKCTKFNVDDQASRTPENPDVFQVVLKELL